jgi:probable HAF family extracellular repeat protein
MKYNIARTMPQFVFLVALFAALVIPARIAAQGQPQQYTVTDLGTLGGTFSGADGINNKGWVTGFATFPGDQEEHAVLWQKGLITDLGTLGGNSTVGFPVKDDGGLIAGFSQTSAIDPLGENFLGPYTCTPSGVLCQGGVLITLGFIWQGGVISALPTLGGNNGAATGVNNRGQVVGFAENSTQDPNCIAPQVLDWEAVIWGPGKGEIHELPPLSGDSVAAAIAINDNGQVVGGSGPTCGPPSFAVSVHAVLWQNGSVTDLGNLGGTMNNIAFAINNQGQVVGISDLAGDTTFHAFLWQNGLIADLGTLPGDFLSFAFGINDEGQVAGQSCDVSGNCRAFLWQNGVMTDLNTLISPGSSLVLIYGGDINSGGEIAGNAFDQSSGEVHAFLATPTGAVANPVESPKLNLPDNVRKLLEQRRGFGRFEAGPARP